MTQYEAATSVVQSLRKAGFEAFLVGGCVRDIILGRKPKDFDVTTKARPEQIVEIFPKTIPIGAAFGVITVMVGDIAIEVATYRSDGEYEDGRHPEAVFYADSVLDDVTRRDFTINGLLMVGEANTTSVAAYEDSLALATDRISIGVSDDSHTYGIIDYTNGLADIEAKSIRCIGDPMRRFEEDALRMLRACRFAAQLDFTIHPTTLAAIQDLAHTITKVSRERIAVELIKIVTSDNPITGLMPLAMTGLLEYLPIHFLKKSMVNVLKRFARFTNKDQYIAMGMLMVELDALEMRPGYLLSHELKLSNEFSEGIEDGINLRNTLLVSGNDILHGPKSDMKRLMRRPGAAIGLALYEQDIVLDNRFIFRQPHGARFAGDGYITPGDAYKLVRELRVLTPEEIKPVRLVNGNDLIAAGFKAGPEFKYILNTLEDMQLNEVFSTKEDGMKIAFGLADDHSLTHLPTPKQLDNLKTINLSAGE